jgi:hypothetical protein
LKINNDANDDACDYVSVNDDEVMMHVTMLVQVIVQVMDDYDVYDMKSHLTFSYK